MVSYLDRLDFGFIVDRDLVPDVWDLADMHIAEITRLFDATGAEWAQPPQSAFPRRGPIKLGQAATTSAAKKATSTNATAKKAVGKPAGAKKSEAGTVRAKQP